MGWLKSLLSKEFSVLTRLNTPTVPMYTRKLINHLLFTCGVFMGTTMSIEAMNGVHFHLSSSLHPQSSLQLAQKPNLTFPPVPAEDKEKGLNSNAHAPGTPELRETEKQDFIKMVTQPAQVMEKQYNIPACAVVAMAIVDSHFGRTRIAHYANNLFKLKYINRKKGCHDGSCEEVKTYQLIGQPNEVSNHALMITESFGGERFIFDESRRFGNRYRVFDSYQESVNFLVEEVWLKVPDYKKVVDQYQSKLKVLNKKRATQEFISELTMVGFAQIPGSKPKDYIKTIYDAIDKWSLCN